MRAKVNPKPATRNGVGRPGSTDKASASTEQAEASKDRSRKRRQAVAMKPSFAERRKRDAFEAE